MPADATRSALHLANEAAVEPSTRERCDTKFPGYPQRCRSPQRLTDEVTLVSFSNSVLGPASAPQLGRMSSECVRCSLHQIVAELGAALRRHHHRAVATAPSCQIWRSIHPPIWASTGIQVKLEALHHSNFPNIDAALSMTLCDKAPWTGQIRGYVDDQTIRWSHSWPERFCHMWRSCVQWSIIETRVTAGRRHQLVP